MVHQHPSPQVFPESKQATSEPDPTLAIPTSRPEITKGQLQTECRTTLSFLERAHKHVVDAARRIGVEENLLQNLTPTAPTDARLDSLAAIRETLLKANNGHTGSFPDFVGMAESLSRYYKEERRKQTGIYPQNHPSSFGFASPVNTLNTCAEMLFVALSLSSNAQQRGSCLILLNLLVSQTRDSMPRLSSDVSTALSETLNFEANRPHFQR